MDTINIKRKRHHNFYCSKYNGEPQLYANDQTQFGSNSVSYYPSNKKSISRFTQLSTFVGNCSHSELIHLTSEIERLLKRNFLADLPYEIAQKVLKYLTPKDLLQCCKVSKAWLLVSQDALLWQNLCKKYDCISLTADSVVMGGSWKELFLKQNQLNCNWRRGTKTPPKLLFGHENHVITCLEVYKDWAISGSDDSSICVWDLISSRRLTTLFGHIGGVWSMTVLPPATELHNNENDCLQNIPLLISGSTDRTARIWRLDNSSWACIATLFGHHSTVRCLAGQALGCSTFSSITSECTEYHQSDESCKTYQRLDIQSTGAGDRLFVSGSRDTTLRLWSASTGHCIHILRGHRGAVRCVQFCGVHIVSGSYDCKIRVWCAVSGSCLRVLRHHTDRVYTLLFDGVRIISGSLDTKIRIWNVITGSLDQTLCGHQSLTSEMALDAKYERLITSNADETIRVWSLNDGQCLHVLAGHNKHQSAVTCVQVTSNFIVSSSDDGTVKLWDRISGEYIRDLICLDSATAGGVVWRIGVTSNRVVCAAGSRCGTETTKLIVLRFDDESDLVPNHCCQSQHLSYPPLKLSQLFYDYLRHKVPCIEASGLLLTGQNDANNPHSIPVCCATADLSQRRDTRTDLSVDFRLPSAILNFYPSP